MPPVDPTQPVSYTRALPASLPATSSAPGATATPAAPVKGVVAGVLRPVNFLNNLPLAPHMPVLLAAKNFSRRAIVLRVFGGDSTTICAIATPDLSTDGVNVGKGYLPILPGETLELDYNGDVFVCVIAGWNANVTFYAVELLTDPGV
jgi:hypothetical protein